jgi:hypothetical protein
VPRATFFGGAKRWIASRMMSDAFTDDPSMEKPKPTAGIPNETGCLS